MAKSRRTKKVERINLSDYSLDINTRKVNFEKFDYREIDEYMRAISGDREYQYEAIKNTMIYLWGGSYSSVTDLAKENFAQKPQIQQKYGSEEVLLNHIPLPDRLSGVVHMATGTGKSWVIFAVAYLSIIMGYVDRVIVLGPSSTVIEQGLNDKFREFMVKPEYVQALPAHLRNKAVDLLNDTDHIADNSITIENINAIYGYGGIRDAMDSSDAEWLVLSDEVHHAYSHLKFDTNNHLALDKDVKSGKKLTGDDQERLWMKFLRENPQIKRHIGFTGTPYNADSFFADVIYNFSLRTAIDQKFIKQINPLIKTGTEDGEEIKWTQDKRYEVIVQTHEDIQKKYSYPDTSGNRRVKPISIFICNTTKAARDKSEEFIKFLAGYEKSRGNITGHDAEIEQTIRERIICVTTAVSESEYKDKLDNIEETDPSKVGGAVEYIFAVNKLSEGWDVDNVFQIVPMQDKVFNSKLLISQVLGRGLRVPRRVPSALIMQNYPKVTVQNHEKFSEHIKEVLDAVIESDMHLGTAPLLNEELSERAKLHFSLFNLNYIADRVSRDAEASEQKKPESLVLTKFDDTENVRIEFDAGEEKYKLSRKRIPIEAVIDSIHKRFTIREYEGVHFDFGTISGDRAPSEEEIRNVIQDAMHEANIIDDGFIHEENKSKIELYFNQFLPAGKKKLKAVQVDGDLFAVNTKELPRISMKVSELDRDGALFLSENYQEEVGDNTRLILEHIKEDREQNIEKNKGQGSLFSDPLNLVGKHNDYVRYLAEDDPRPPFIVNPTVLKTPQSGIAVSHTPEKVFVFNLLQHTEYITSFIKSPDMSFYQLNYEYWKKGKDRVVRAFNPDFFILLKLETYIDKLEAKQVDVDRLQKLQDSGIDYIVKIVEIKSDTDNDETIRPKAEAGKLHAEKINKNLLMHQANPQNFSEEARPFIRSYYTFDLLREGGFIRFFRELSQGVIEWQ